jgi:hypothetical protein
VLPQWQLYPQQLLSLFDLQPNDCKERLLYAPKQPTNVLKAPEKVGYLFLLKKAAPFPH